MLKNFFKIAWRHFAKNPACTIIQVAGLTIGLTAFLLIMLWVNNQISFDRFNEKADRIYRLELNSPEFQGWTQMCLAMGPEFKRNIAGIEEFVRFRMLGGKLRWKPAGDEDYKEIEPENSIYTDSSFFSVFSFKPVYGDPFTALQSPGGIVLTESLSKKLFGNEFPIGKEVLLRNSSFTVAAVIEDVDNFHIPFQVVKSFIDMKSFYKEANVNFGWDSWESGFWHPTYFLLHKNTSSEAVSRQMTEFYKSTANRLYPDSEFNIDCHLRPLTDIYFFGQTEREFGYVLHGNIRLITVMVLIAILILLLACVNFINLNLARTFNRAKEIGVRKITGSNRANIFGLFTGEVLLLYLIVFVLSLLMIELMLPHYNNLISTNFSFSDIFNPYNLITLLGSFFLILLLAGVIPSWSIAQFSPIAAIRSFGQADSRKKMASRKLFLGMQYGITIVVIAATLIVQKQLHFMKNSDPGFNMNNVLVTGYNYDKYKSETRKELFKNRILQHPDVEKAAFAHTYPPYGEPSFFSIEFNDKTVPTYSVYLHPGFFDLLEIPIVAGRNFRQGSQADKVNWGTNQPLRVMLNETAVKAYGIEDPVGYMGTVGERQVEIIGVVKDYHQQSLKTEIPPIVFTYNPMAYGFLIKTISGKYQDVIKHIARVKEEMSNHRSDILALEDRYNKQYRSEEQMAKLFIWFSMLSVTIAVMGLFGISTYAMQRRIKEIGIRKVNGAHSWNIMKLLQAYFTKIVIWAGIITLPVSWYLANQWLLNYPYKTDLNWWIFLGALIFVFVIAILTISWKTWKAANGNPVDALRYE